VRKYVQQLGSGQPSTWAARSGLLRRSGASRRLTAARASTPTGSTAASASSATPRRAADLDERWQRFERPSREANMKRLKFN